MYKVLESGTGRELTPAPTEIGSALYAAVVLAAAGGIDTDVVMADQPDVVLFGCEADTKVDNEDRFFPVIVHRDSIIPGVVD